MSLNLTLVWFLYGGVVALNCYVFLFKCVFGLNEFGDEITVAS